MSTDSTPATPSPSAPRARWLPGAVAGVLAGAAVVLVLAWYGGSRVSTDDAFLDASIVTVAPSVAGRIAAVHVDDNQAVKRGDLLVEIDPRSYATTLAQKASAKASAEASVPLAAARLAEANASLHVLEADAEAARAGVDAAGAEAVRASEDLRRDEALVKTGAITAQEFDRARAAATATGAEKQAARKRAAAAVARIEQGRTAIQSAEANVEVARSEARQADDARTHAAIDFENTQVRAPGDGFVTRKAVNPGDYAEVGQALLALVSPELWVSANFKESQIGDMRPGQAVEIEIDSEPGRTYRGHVDSIQAGSGARFSLFPPENATGNYVKIVQRVPVKIVFDEPLDPGVRLGPGESVSPVVITGAHRLRGFPAAAVGGTTLVLIAGLAWFAKRKKAA